MKHENHKPKRGGGHMMSEREMGMNRGAGGARRVRVATPKKGRGRKKGR